MNWYDQGVPFSFSAEIGEDGSVTYRYKDIADTAGGFSTGRSATVGVENATGTDALQYSLNTEALSDGLSIAFRTTKSGVVLGTVRDGNDNRPVSGVEVTTGATSTTTDSDGRYALHLGTGKHTLAFSATGYTGGEKTVTVEPGRVADASVSLATGRVALDQRQVTVVAPADQTRKRTVTLSNTGSATRTRSSKPSAVWRRTCRGSRSRPPGASWPRAPSGRRRSASTPRATSPATCSRRICWCVPAAGAPRSSGSR
ncbi:carboxypeptidase regulatory-like domain-containing protein [Streptomyces sp. INA 01156]